MILLSGFNTDYKHKEKGNKYSKKAFRELVLSIAHLPLQQQREALYNAHMQWRGNNEQVDDICVIGVRV